MCMELGMHLRFAFARVSSTLRGQVGYISVSLTHGQPSECSVLCSCGQPREIPILLLFVVHSLIRQTFKAVFEYPSRRFWRPSPEWQAPRRVSRPQGPQNLQLEFEGLPDEGVYDEWEQDRDSFSCPH